MKSDWYEELFGKLLANRQSVNDFATLQQGSRMATSVGGALTGRGGDALIIDDPMKPSEALSDVERARVIEWFDHTLLSRLNDKENGVIIIIMQRLHQWDLIGHVLQHGDWEVLSFPAIAEKTETIIFEDIFGRHRIIRPEGQALNPALESLEALKDMRSRMGEYNFSAQYQQNPTPIGGTIIKREWLRFYEANELPERFSRIVMSWDTANKATELSDYSVCTIWGVHDRKCYLLNVIRKRLDYPNLKRKIIELAADYPSAQILIEDKASGTQLIQDLQYDGMHGIVPYTPAANTDKIMRLHAQSARFENGMVYLPKQAPWLDEYIRELMSFPSARYDDQVDSTTQALDYMRKRTSFEVFEALGRL